MAESIEQEVARLRAEVAELRQLLDDLAVEVERGKALEQIRESFDPPVFKNSYNCPRCGQSWDSLADSMCNDHCPICDLGDVMPVNSMELFVGDVP